MVYFHKNSNLKGLGMEYVGICYGHLVISWLFGTFSPFWYIGEEEDNVTRYLIENGRNVPK
jgi:hypothetical protein